MKVVYGISRYDLNIEKCVLVIGVFDGVHAGHQRLLGRACKQAQKIGGRVVVMTFDPHPAHVLRPEKKLPLIVSLEHRLHLLERYGAHAALVVRFTKSFSRQSPENFIQKYLVKTIKPCDVYVGGDFRFGQDRSGGLDLFREKGRQHGFNVHAVEPKKSGEGKVSSTDIRRLIQEGSLREARKFLGHDVAIMGCVIKGDGRGKSLGFPTANLKTDKGMIPPRGVYATRIEIDGKLYDSMTNIGCRPSFKRKGSRELIETHIFRFSRDIYGKTVILHFIRQIRDEQIFPDEKAFVQQLTRDARSAEEILK